MKAIDALNLLKKGNSEYINAKYNTIGDISIDKRLLTFNNGQHPFAVVITCSDSRVIPEDIFMTGIGDLFTIRTAGNVLGDFGLGSVEYGVEHLGCKLVLVLGHTNCGAVASTLKGGASSYIASITKEIKEAIGSETNPTSATILNINNQIQKINNSPVIKEELNKGLMIIGGLYNIDTGIVNFFEGEEYEK